MTWHVPQASFLEYAEGSIDEARAMSIEAHLVSCDLCRRAASNSVDQQRLLEIWEYIAPRTRPRSSGRPWTTRVGALMRDSAFRLRAVTPVSGLSWMVAVGLVQVFVVATSYLLHGTPLPFLLIAPLVPLVGVAAAYSPSLDRSYEIAIAAPISCFKLLLLRAACVLAMTMPIAAMASLLLPHLPWTAVGWILPSLALVSAALAMSTAMPPVTAAAIAGLTWVIFVLATSTIVNDRLAAFRGGAQIPFALMTAACILLLFLRRQAMEKEGPPTWKFQ